MLKLGKKALEISRQLDKPSRRCSREDIPLGCLVAQVLALDLCGPRCHLSLSAQQAVTRTKTETVSPAGRTRFSELCFSGVNVGEAGRPPKGDGCWFVSPILTSDP